MALAYQPDEPVALLDLPADFYAVQLMALQSPEAVEQFVTRNRLQGMSAARVAVDGDLRYALILGIYETEPLAQRALVGLPKPLRQFKPWLRKLSNLQEAMLQADRIAGGR